MSKKAPNFRELQAKKPYFVNGVKFDNCADALNYVKAIGGKIIETNWKPYAMFITVCDNHLKIA